MADGNGTRALFGGAISVRIPAQFADISQIREIPDNQEVFAHAETDRSLIVELLQLESDLTTSTPSGHHFAVLARDSGAAEASLFYENSLPATDYPLIVADDRNAQISLACGRHRVSKFKDNDQLANLVHVYVACIRLSRADTDLLLVFNDPVELHPEGASARSGSSVAKPEETDMNERGIVLREALSSVQVKDWGLFC